MNQNSITCGWKPSRDAWIRTERRAENMGYTSWKPACIRTEEISAWVPSSVHKVRFASQELRLTPREVPPILVEPISADSFGLIDGQYRLVAAKAYKMERVPVLVVTSPRKPRNTVVKNPYTWW
jgi:hypothetical protein